MLYGDGFASADDVVGHELTHGVTQFESNLLYYYQSGAINESLSDVFGEFVDLTNGVGNDTAGVRWLLGEDLSIGAIRNMANPPAFGDPDRMTSSLYTGTTSDNGGVHTNSGVNNKAASLMVDGGTFNGHTVTALGIDKVARFYYKAQVDLLTSGSDYSDLGNAGAGVHEPGRDGLDHERQLHRGSRRGARDRDGHQPAERAGARSAALCLRRGADEPVLRQPRELGERQLGADPGDGHQPLLLPRPPVRDERNDRHLRRRPRGDVRHHHCAHRERRAAARIHDLPPLRSRVRPRIGLRRRSRRILDQQRLDVDRRRPALHAQRVHGELVGVGWALLHRCEQRLPIEPDQPHVARRPERAVSLPHQERLEHRPRRLVHRRRARVHVRGTGARGCGREARVEQREEPERRLRRHELPRGVGVDTRRHR